MNQLFFFALPRQQILILLLLIVQSNLLADQYKSSQTIMFTRPLYHDVAATTFLWRTFSADANNAVRITPLYQHTIDDGKNVGSYFLINCKKELLIAGDTAATQKVDDRDVRAEWLGLPANLTSTMSLTPEQRQSGAVISYHKALGHLFKSEFLNDSWIDVSVPFVWVENKLSLTTQRTRLGNSVADGSIVAEAFNQPAQRFAKIANCPLKKNGIAEIRASWGTTWTCKNDFLLQYSTGIIIPTAHKSDPEYLFSPMSGTDGHWGLNAAFYAELPLQPENAPYSCRLFICAENNFLFHDHQLRTFDLYKKPWSRYLLYRKEGEETTVQGNKILTLPVKVHTYSLFNLATGLTFEVCNFNFEFGYKLWAHPGEKLSCLRPSCEGAGFSFEKYGIAGTGTNSASESTISTLATDDSNFTTIKRSQLCSKSASARGAFTQMAHVAFGYSAERTFFGLGGSYEQPSTNTALEQWSLWATVGMQF